MVLSMRGVAEGDDTPLHLPRRTYPVSHDWIVPGVMFIKRYAKRESAITARAAIGLSREACAHGRKTHNGGQALMVSTPRLQPFLDSFLQ